VGVRRADAKAATVADQAARCEINIARPATRAAAKVPMKAACTNGTDLRKVLRIDCSRSADCYTDSAKSEALLAGNCGNSESL